MRGGYILRRQRGEVSVRNRRKEPGDGRSMAMRTELPPEREGWERRRWRPEMRQREVAAGEKALGTGVAQVTEPGMATR